MKNLLLTYVIRIIGWIQLIKIISFKYNWNVLLILENDFFFLRLVF